MTQHKALILSAMMVVGGLLLAPTALAEDQPKDTTSNTTVKEQSEAREKIAEERKKAIEEQAKALRERVKTEREAIKTKLDDKRLDICKKRQANINRIAAKSTEQANKHLSTFQKIEERVKEFYVSKNLSVANYDALVAAVDEKEAAAIAAIAVAGETTFNCDTTDGDKPGKVVSDLMKSKHTALKEYRTAIKNLIVAVKQAAEGNE